MGTKANPGPHDCYAAAADDEPIFVLRAKDPLAADLVRAWARKRAVMRTICSAFSSLDGVSAERCREALDVADAMDEWRNRTIIKRETLVIPPDAPRIYTVKCWKPDASIFTEHSVEVIDKVDLALPDGRIIRIVRQKRC